MINSNENRRGTLRLTINEKVICKKYSINNKISKFKPAIELETLDISVGGMGMIAKQRLQVFTIIMFEIALGNDIIDIQGEVKYCNLIPNGYRFGIEFKCMSNRDMDVIKNFIEVSLNEKQCLSLNNV